MTHDSNDIGEDFKEVCARYGLAMYNAQCLEKQVGLVVGALEQQHGLHPTGEALDARFNKLLEENFGALIRMLAIAPTGLNQLAQRLDTARIKRNWLAHDYWWDRAHHLRSNKGRLLMETELFDLRDEFSKLDGILTRWTERWASNVGMTQELLALAAEELLNEANDDARLKLSEAVYS